MDPIRKIRTKLISGEYGCHLPSGHFNFPKTHEIQTLAEFMEYEDVWVFRSMDKKTYNAFFSYMSHYEFLYNLDKDIITRTI